MSAPREGTMREVGAPAPASAVTRGSDARETLPDAVPEPTDEQRRAVDAARREIRAARKARERAQEQERAATLRLGRALAAAPRGRGPGKITTAELAELAGLEQRTSVYELIHRAEQAADTTKPDFRATEKRSRQGGR